MRPFLPSDLERLQARALERASARYEAFLARGFPTADFPGQPEPERLQCRNVTDRTNWLGLLAKCQEAKRMSVELNRPGIMAGIATTIRCASNRMYPVTYNDAKARMLALLDDVDTAQQNWWRVKDLVQAAEARSDVEQIEIGGWP